MTYNFDKMGEPSVPSWFNFEVEYLKLEKWNQFLIERLETANEFEMVQIQHQLNRICFTKERINQLEKEYRI